MRIKHNKKRNTAFVYEALIKEANCRYFEERRCQTRESYRIN